MKKVTMQEKIQHHVSSKSKANFQAIINPSWSLLSVGVLYWACIGLMVGCLGYFWIILGLLGFRLLWLGFLQTCHLHCFVIWVIGYLMPISILISPLYFIWIYLDFWAVCTCKHPLLCHINFSKIRKALFLPSLYSELDSLHLFHLLWWNWIVLDLLY